MNIDFNKAYVLLDVAERCTFYPGKFSSLQAAAMQELVDLNMEIKKAAVAEAERALAEAERVAERVAEEQQKAMAAILVETVTEPKAIPTDSSETTQTVTEPTTMPEAVTEPTATSPVERKI